MKLALPRQHTPLAVLVTSVIVVMIAFTLLAQGKKVREKAADPKQEELIKSARDQEFKKFSLVGFDDQGKKFWNLEGDTAKINPDKIVYLQQNVTLKLRDDTIIRTDNVQWSQDGGVMRTNAPVDVDHQSVKIKGIGALGRPAESFIQLNRDIDVSIQPNTHITCKGPMKIYYKDNKLIFYRDVKVVDQRGSLSANRMDVLFDPETKKVKQIFAMGNVVIVRAGDTTRSHKAIYSLATGSIRLEGNPEITLHKGSTALLDGTFRN